jgi:hypothetical protein
MLDENVTATTRYGADFLFASEGANSEIGRGFCGPGRQIQLTEHRASAAPGCGSLGQFESRAAVMTGQDSMHRGMGEKPAFAEFLCTR